MGVHARNGAFGHRLRCASPELSVVQKAVPEQDHVPPESSCRWQSRIGYRHNTASSAGSSTT